MKQKKIGIGILLLVFIIILTGCNSSDYKKAVSLYEDHSYIDALDAFESLGDYQESKEFISECYYNLGRQALNNGDYEKAAKYFSKAVEQRDGTDELKTILFSLLTGEFKTQLTASSNAFSEYTTSELNRYKQFVQDYISGKGEDTFEFDYKDENLSKMESSRVLMEASFLKIDQIFTSDILQVCDSDTLSAYESAVKLKDYAKGLFTMENALKSLVNSLDKSQKADYTTTGMIEVLGEFQDAINRIDPSSFTPAYLLSHSDNTNTSNSSNSGKSGTSSFSEKNSSTSSVRFTNKYGTPTTKCAHSGCTNYIASSGDTNCCTVHSHKCKECGKYIDEDATWCMDCISKATGNSSGSSNSGQSGSSKSGSSKGPWHSTNVKSDGMGPYPCYGKGNTCSNTTKNYKDLYCDSCDPDGDNIENK